MKVWTYAEITETAEQDIRFYIEKDDANIINRTFAHGAYLLWRNLTMGWQNDGDDERLSALIAEKKI